MQPATGQGFAQLGLPGDLTPPSRFVRTVYYKANSECEENTESLVNQFFHVLSSVEFVNGSIVVAQDQNGNNINDITLYSSCIDLNEMVYYYKTY